MMESFQEFVDKNTNESYSLEDVRDQIVEIKGKLQDMETLVEDNPDFGHLDRARRVIYKMLGDLESLQHMVPVIQEGTWALPDSYKERSEQSTHFIHMIEDLKEEIYNVFGDDILFDHFDGAIKRLEELAESEHVNEDVNIPPDLSNQYLVVKKQILDKQMKKDQLMKSVNQVDNEMNILQKNLVAIETKAAQLQGQQEAEKNSDQNSNQAKGTETIEIQGNVKESIDLDEWWEENVTEALEADEIAELHGEEPVAPVEVAADPVEDAVEDEELIDAEEAGSLEGDYVFTLEIEDDGEEENIIAKFYKDEEDDYWKARVVQGSEEPVESMQFDPIMDKVDIIEHLGSMFDEVVEIKTEDYEEMLDDKEKLDGIFYDDLIKEE